MASLNLHDLSENRYIDVVFDNTGGITLMTNDYSHYYNDSRLVAEEVYLLAQGTEEGVDIPIEPKTPIKRNVEIGQNGDYVWYSREDIQKILDSGITGDAIRGGENVQLFFAHLRELVDAAET